MNGGRDRGSAGAATTAGPLGPWAGHSTSGASSAPSPSESGSLSLFAVAASMLLCWVFYRVRMRRCEAVLQDIARALQDVRRTAEALQTRRRIVKAATVTAEKALVEYNTFLNMLHQMQEGDGNLPILRHQIEREAMRAQVSMVQGCLLAMSQEVLNFGPLNESKQEDVLASLHQQRKAYTHMSEELLTFLDKHSSEANPVCAPSTKL